MTDIPWEERVSMLSINPDAATQDDIARLAAELMEANYKLEWVKFRLKNLTDIFEA
jgi:hypothetical protein